MIGDGARVPFQTRMNTQTSVSAKGALSMIRSLSGWSQDTGNVLRYTLPKMLFPDFISTGPGKVNGIVGGRALSVSGHMLGVIAMYANVDVYEWFNHLKTNFIIQDGRSILRKQVHEAQRSDELTEESMLSPFALHHSPNDEIATWVVALGTAYALDLPIPVRFMADLLRYLKRLKHTKRLAESQVGLEFRKKFNPTSAVDWRPLV